MGLGHRNRTDVLFFTIDTDLNLPSGIVFDIKTVSLENIGDMGFYLLSFFLER